MSATMPARNRFLLFLDVFLKPKNISDMESPRRADMRCKRSKRLSPAP
jgi:hypothetical protein